MVVGCLIVRVRIGYIEGTMPIADKWSICSRCSIATPLPDRQTCRHKSCHKLAENAILNSSPADGYFCQSSQHFQVILSSQIVIKFSTVLSVGSSPLLLPSTLSSRRLPRRWIQRISRRSMKEKVKLTGVGWNNLGARTASLGDGWRRRKPTGKRRFLITQSLARWYDNCCVSCFSWVDTLLLWYSGGGWGNTLNVTIPDPEVTFHNTKSTW